MGCTVESGVSEVRCIRNRLTVKAIVRCDACRSNNGQVIKRPGDEAVQ